MKPRLVATAVLGSLIATLPAAADRRSKKRAVAETEEEDQDGPEAKSALTIKLDDLIEVAVRLSPSLARSKNDRLTAKGQATASRAGQQWVVTSKGEASRYAVGPEVEVGPFQVVAENKLSASLGIGRNLPTGGNIGFELGVQRSLKEYEIPAELGRLMNDNLANQIPKELDQNDSVVDESIINQGSAKLSFKQPLARGFGPNAALADERRADLNAAAATVNTQFEAEKLIREVVASYWALAYAAYEVETRAAALALAKDQEAKTRLEFRGGTKPETEVNAVMYEVSIREEALIAAKNQYEKASIELRKTVGLELDRRDIVLRPVDPFEVETTAWDIEEVLVESRKGNRQIASLILQKRAAEVDVKLAKNGMLPKLDFELSGTVFGSGNTPDAAISASAGGAGFQVLGSLTLQFEIGGAAKGNYDAAMAKRQRLEVDQADAMRTVEAEVIHSVHAVKAAQTRVALAERAITIAEKNVTAERANFQASRSDNYRVMQRHTELVDAKLRRGKAIADYHSAVAQVQFLGGMLLEQYRVSVRPLPKQ